MLPVRSAGWLTELEKSPTLNLQDTAAGQFFALHLRDKWISRVGDSATEMRHIGATEMGGK